jgi:CNT family concentrative nucleoside transporter
MAQYGKPIGLVFFFGVLTTIIFFASLMSILYHLGIMQAVVKAVAWVMVRTMGTSGAESLSAAANIFVGQTEAPLVVRPYVAQMTRSELMAVMTGGFATIAGGVMAAYVAFGIDAGTFAHCFRHQRTRIAGDGETDGAGDGRATDERDGSRHF